MTNNSDEINPQQVDHDPFLIQQDEEVFDILISSTNNDAKYDELLGMIAYAKYSLQKHQYITLYKRENEGQLPSKEMIKAIITPFKQENSAALSSLKQSSEQFLKEYAQEYLENAKREELLKPIEDIIKKYTNFWVSLGTNLLAALIYSFLVAIIIFIATAAVPNTKFAKIIKILMEENTTEITPK